MTPEPQLLLHNGLGRWAVIVVLKLSFPHACLEMKYPLLLHLIAPPILSIILLIQLFILFILISCELIIISPSHCSRLLKNTHTARLGHERLFMKLLAEVQITFRVLPVFKDESKIQ